MALIKCKECGREISNKAEFCPHCGAPGEVSKKLGRLNELNAVISEYREEEEDKKKSLEVLSGILFGIGFLIVVFSFSNGIKTGIVVLKWVVIIGLCLFILIAIFIYSFRKVPKKDYTEARNERNKITGFQKLPAMSEEEVEKMRAEMEERAKSRGSCDW